MNRSRLVNGCLFLAVASLVVWLGGGLLVASLTLFAWDKYDQLSEATVWAALTAQLLAFFFGWLYQKMKK